MSKLPETVAEVAAEARAFLSWQKRLGAPGVPYDFIRERKARAEAAPAAKPPVPEDEPETHVLPSVAPLFPAPKAEPSSLARPKHEEGLRVIREEIGDCQRCKLGATRHKLVFGEGNPHARIMFVGEGPGADEDESGRPFVGRAGQLLTKWIELGMGLPRSEVFIANIVKCRPPQNRDPEPDEVAACIGFVRAQIAAVDPEVLVLLGRVPLTHLLGVKEGITRIHGQWLSLDGRPTIALFHPSYCLRPPLDEKRRLVWEDIKTILTFLKLPIPQKN